jgi:hypothetical protein
MSVPERVMPPSASPHYVLILVLLAVILLTGFILAK